MREVPPEGYRAMEAAGIAAAFAAVDDGGGHADALKAGYQAMFETIAVEAAKANGVHFDPAPHREHFERIADGLCEAARHLDG